MGNDNHKADQLHFNPEHWQEVQKSTFYEVMKSNKGQEANLYHFNIKSQRKLDEQVDLYHKRRSPANWIQVIGANLQKSGFGFCGHQENANVLTERIPYLLNSVQRLNRQQSLVVLYNALRGYNDISKLIVPASITDRMIGFTSQGQTKVWINQNFGMNYPSHHHEDAKVDHSQIINDLVNTISPRADLAPQFINDLKKSGNIQNALGFIRNNGGVSESVLEGNRINVQSNWGQTQVNVLRDTAPLVQNVATTQVVQPVQLVQANYAPTQQFGYVPHTAHRNNSVHFAYNNPPVNASTLIGQSSIVQPSYARVGQPVGQSKYSFQAQ